MIRRFLNLENQRKKKGLSAEQPRLEGSDRFSSLSKGAPTATERVPEEHVERFRGDADPPLALDESPDGPSFQRCAQCSADSSRFVEACQLCGADLKTPGQRAFNAELWHAKQREAAQEKTQLEALEQARKAQALADAQNLDRMFDELRNESANNDWLLMWANRWLRRWGIKF